jgi:predicted AlkP superfamily pyrophosphatase or phosphodiesterase
MNRTAVINAVGLTSSLLGPSTPHLSRLAARCGLARINPAFPAVTCTAQANYLTGTTPAHHGIVGNGWYDRALAEVHFWKQSNRLVDAPKVWDRLRALDSQCTCANLFWWFNMYSTVDYSITPRPMYPADGRKIFDIYSHPASLRPEIKNALGEFPFPTFWGPAAGVNTPQGGPDAASRWIAESAKWVENKYSPTLSLVYLPHLDYNLQRLGPYRAASSGLELNPAIAPDLQQIDAIVGDLAAFYQSRGVRLVLLSEYGITNVDTPIHLNRIFRQRGWIAVREELGLEILDAGASQVFAVADHQVAHVYLNNPRLRADVEQLLAEQPGIESVNHINHPRAGEWVAVARENAWFTYYYWLDDAKAPDFARCVDIHRKPGYDPVELFLDPAIPFVRLKILARLARKKLGFRMLMDVIPLDATLVKGSHGRPTTRPEDQPVLLCDPPVAPLPASLNSTDVASVILQQVCGAPASL